MFRFLLNWRKPSTYFKIAVWQSDSMKRNFGGFTFNRHCKLEVVGDLGKKFTVNIFHPMSMLESLLRKYCCSKARVLIKLNIFLNPLNLGILKYLVLIGYWENLIKIRNIVRNTVGRKKFKKIPFQMLFHYSKTLKSYPQYH